MAAEKHASLWVAPVEDGKVAGRVRVISSTAAADHFGRGFAEVEQADDGEWTPKGAAAPAKAQPKTSGKQSAGGTE